MKRWYTHIDCCKHLCWAGDCLYNLPTKFRKRLHNHAGDSSSFFFFYMPFKYNGKNCSKILVFFSGGQWLIQARIWVLLDLQEKIVIEARPLSQISPGPSGVIFTNILATIEVIRCLVCSSPWRRRIQRGQRKEQKAPTFHWKKWKKTSSGQVHDSGASNKFLAGKSKFQVQEDNTSWNNLVILQKGIFFCHETLLSASR